MRRYILFFITNILIVATISIVCYLLGITNFLNAKSINFGILIPFCLIWGFGGAFISLLLSKKLAYWTMGVKNKDSELGRKYLSQVSSIELKLNEFSKKAKLPKVPEFGIYQSADINAFATGPSKSNSLIAFSTGALDSLNQEEIEGVLAHEVAHIANGDMVTMTLVQGIVNAFVMFIARVLAWFASQAIDEDKRSWVQFGITFALEIILGFLGMIVVASFSRKREFRADYDGAKIAGPDKMINALIALKNQHPNIDSGERESALASFKINNSKSNFFKLFLTHPPLELRIKNLRIQFNQRVA